MPTPHVSAQFLVNVAACEPVDGALIFAGAVTLHLVVNESGKWALGQFGGHSISAATHAELLGAIVQRDANDRETGFYIRADLAVRGLSIFDGAALPGPVPDPPDPED